MEGFVILLDRLGVGIDDVPDMYDKCRLLVLLTEVVRSLEGRQSLSYLYWEFMPELALGSAMDGTLDRSWLHVLRSPELRTPGSVNYEVQIMVSLEEEQQWDKLECWMGFVWFILRPKIDSIPEDVERVTLSLLRQRPGAAKKLERQLHRGTVDDTPECIEYLQRVCEQAGLGAASRQDVSWVSFSATSCTLTNWHSRSISSIDVEAKGPAQPPPPAFPLLVGDDTY